MGHLRLTGVAEDQYHGGDQLSFNPTRTVPGMGLSGDPMLHARGDVYRLSYQRRTAVAGPPVQAAPSHS
jgi:catalase